MKRNLLIGLSLLCLFACKDKAAETGSASPALAADDDGDGDGDETPEPGRHGGRGRWGGGFCKKATDEQWAAMQKCSDKLPAEQKTAQEQCNTQVHGVATPTKAQACDREKRRAMHKCMKEKNPNPGANREARKEFFQCMVGVMKGAGEGAAPSAPAAPAAPAAQ